MAGVWAGRVTQGHQHYTEPADSQTALLFPAVGGGRDGGQSNISFGRGKPDKYGDEPK